MSLRMWTNSFENELWLWNSAATAIAVDMINARVASLFGHRSRDRRERAAVLRAERHRQLQSASARPVRVMGHVRATLRTRALRVRRRQALMLVQLLRAPVPNSSFRASLRRRRHHRSVRSQAAHLLSLQWRESRRIHTRRLAHSRRRRRRRRRRRAGRRTASGGDIGVGDRVRLL